ncbi:Zinc transporter 9 [Plakobranchus ocellatus]|uniref:Zinc transporter 9 n=1 Tax=Plakobranchus ocellatus TaxID=259542 RepID=A0AAV3YHE0_9GAST|nr:Zinc transporter 9 [Plakobranchus ocellatus]
MLKIPNSEFWALTRTIQQMNSILQSHFLCRVCHRQLFSSFGHATTSSQIPPVFKPITLTHHRSLMRKCSSWSHNDKGWRLCLSRYLTSGTNHTQAGGGGENSGQMPKDPIPNSRVLSQTHPVEKGAVGATGDGDEKLGKAQGESQTTESEADEQKKKNKLLRVTPRMRKPNPIDYSYTGNIYILPQRALVEYLLKPSDLNDLPKYTRRSPYADGNRITLYLRSDVEAVALEKWKTFDKLNKEKAKLRNIDTHDLMDLRALLVEMRGTKGYLNPDDPKMRQDVDGDQETAANEQKAGLNEDRTLWKSGSGRVVLSAILVNGLNTLLKLIAWFYTGSHSMFSEFVHSCADTMNQIILGIGLYHSFKQPDTDHPYGYRNLRHISSLISGVGIFFFGTGLSYYHCAQGLLHPTQLDSLYWCIATLAGSFVSEGATLLIAINQVRKSSHALDMTFREYYERQDISQLLETDRMIRSLHDIKATEMGGIVRYKAEVDFDGREITRAYLYKQDIDAMLLEAKGLETTEDLEKFMLNHGEKIIDALGAEVDRIEKSLKSKHPEIRHVDLEAL